MRQQPITVGEIIASHHWRDARDRAKADTEPFENSHLGRAFRAMLNAHGAAWQRHGQEHVSDKALRSAWLRAEDAEQVFLTLLKRVIGT